MAEGDVLSYEDRVVAFVDVLGFSELTRASRHNEGALKTLSDLVAANKIFEDFYRKVLDFGTATFFSDSFVVSMQPEQAWYLFRHTGQLCRYLLLKGLPCRGAITVGPLYHVDNIVVGPALVDAHDLERKAITPRVVLDKRAIALWKYEFRDGGAYPELEILLKESGGQYIIDIFHPRWADSFQLWPDGTPSDHADFIDAAMSVIMAGQEATADNEHVRQKYEWLEGECARHATK